MGIKDYINLNIGLSCLTIYSEIKTIKDNKKIEKSNNNFINNLAVGDNIITIGGIIGTITHITNDLITIENNDKSLVIHISAILNKV